MINKLSSKFMTWTRSLLGPMMGLIFLCVLFSIMSDKFFTIVNAQNILKATSTNIMLACAMTLIIIMGQIDISVGSIVGLCGIITATFITKVGMPIWSSIVIALIIGMILGLFNGFFIAKLNIPPFIVTLATLNIARGLCQVICDGVPVRCSTEDFTIIGSYTVFGGLSISVVYSIIFVIIICVLMYKTRMGAYIYAIGGNRQAAEYSGINVKKIMIIPYIISGLFAAFCGVMWTARLGSATPTLGANYELDAIAATVLGGTSMSGGIGKIGGTMIGVLIIGVINNGLVLLSVNSFWQLVAKGCVVLAAVVIDVTRKNGLGSIKAKKIVVKE